MVGQPKHLHDLRKIEADVRVTCRECGFEVDWTVADLSAHLLSIGGNLTWSEITRLLVCRRQSCGSPRLRASAVPFARRPANLPRAIGKLDQRTVAVAIEVLGAAVSRSPRQSVATLDVHLALLVVHRYLRAPELVRGFWRLAGDPLRPASAGLNDALGMIRQRLMERGWLAPEPVVEQPRTWPWASPAPPGWLEGANSPGREGDDG